MKHILFFILFSSFSFISFSQRNKGDTISLFQEKKKVKKDAVQEIQSHPDNINGSIKYIKYGTSTGDCMGYCFHEATIDSIHTIKINKSLPADINHPEKTESLETTSSQWDILVSSVQVNSFFEIPQKVGNPGVGYEAFEWIEINYSGKIHKVTFDSTGPEEYEGLKNLSKQLKQITGF